MNPYREDALNKKKIEYAINDSQISHVSFFKDHQSVILPCSLFQCKLVFSVWIKVVKLVILVNS